MAAWETAEKWPQGQEGARGSSAVVCPFWEGSWEGVASPERRPEGAPPRTPHCPVKRGHRCSLCVWWGKRFPVTRGGAEFFCCCSFRDGGRLGHVGHCSGSTVGGGWGRGSNPGGPCTRQVPYRLEFVVPYSGSVLTGFGLHLAVLTGLLLMQCSGMDPGCVCGTKVVPGIEPGPFAWTICASSPSPAPGWSCEVVLVATVQRNDDAEPRCP